MKAFWGSKIQSVAAFVLAEILFHANACCRGSKTPALHTWARGVKVCEGSKHFLIFISFELS
jgi:hypothetical protein